MIRDGVAPLKQIHSDAQLMRKSAVADVKAGRPAPDCPHPAAAVIQWIDVIPGVGERSVNLYQCEICKADLWMVDAHGKAASDT